MYMYMCDRPYMAVSVMCCICYVTIHGVYLLCDHRWAVSLCDHTWTWAVLLCDHTWAVSVMWPYMGCICYMTIHGLYLLCDHTWAVSVM